MDPLLHDSLSQLQLAAQSRQLTRKAWAERAGLRKETLSRVFRRADCDLSTLSGLAKAVGQRLELLPEPDREMPAQWNRDVEEKYLELCASESLDLRRWLAAGPRYFASGLATLCAGVRKEDREAYLALAQALCPAMRGASEFTRWLELSPAKAYRFLPMLRARRDARAG